MSLRTVMQRLTERPPRNVGGGDLVTRFLAIAGLALMAGMVAPQAKISFPLVKITLLTAAELGLMSLMLGLFLRTKTYFVGLQLFCASLAMLYLANRNFPLAAVTVGLLFVAVGMLSVVTRRSRLNAVLEINSLRVPLEEADDAAAAQELLDVESGGKKTPPHGPPLKAAAQGGAR